MNPTQMAWFQNPTWERHIVLDGATPRDNVCMAAADIDGDGRPEVALGATWRPRDTDGGGTLHLAARSTPDGRQPWTVRPLASEPTLHRINWADVDGSGRPALIVAPLHGRGTAPPDWNGPGARLFILRPPRSGAGDWQAEDVDATRHILHNFLAANLDDRSGEEIITASREGLTQFTRTGDGRWRHALIGEGHPGEVALGRVGGRRLLASVEPWHGTAIVIHRDGGSVPWPRTVIETELTGGHALGWADFDGDGDDELTVGWRDGEGGLALYDVGADGQLLTRTMIDAGGVAVEDLAIADLDADGRPDLVAGGRRTENIRIYWNEAPR
jgi:FG-GAP-like repeat/FG-GAP repeat